MSVTVSYPIDELQIQKLIDDGYTHLTLWVANKPDGVYTNSGQASDPVTLAAALAAETYTFTFLYPAGNPGQWGKVRAYDGANHSALSDSSPFHFGGGTTLAVLREMLGKKLRDYVSGVTTSAGSPTELVAATFDVVRYPDNHFTNQYVRLPDSEELTQCTASLKSTGALTLSPPVASVAQGVAFEVTRRWTPDEYRDAINRAISTAYPYLNRTIVSTAVRSADNVYVYDVPQDIRILGSVQVESDVNLTSTDPATRGHPWRDIAFRVRRSGLNIAIEVDREIVEDRRLRVIGMGALSLLYNDSDYVEIVQPQTDLILNLAAHYLWKALPQDAAATDIDRAEQMSDYFMALYLKDRDTFAMPRPPRQYWAHDAMVLGDQQRSDWRWQQ